MLTSNQSNESSDVDISGPDARAGVQLRQGDEHLVENVFAALLFNAEYQFALVLYSHSGGLATKSSAGSSQV